MLGDRGRAREAAARAVALAPDVERTQITRGFADLAEFRTGAAKEAFERAIELAPADPLPRLGLGLAQIREGDLEQGRENLEVAVGLNGNDALLRAYLGKAYFEEKRDELADEQYAIAKELDPLDPTAYLYEAIKQQTENRPVEALQNLQKSIELNDNRAIYRSRLLLDQDRAARGTSLARIYDDLGFEQLGLNEAAKSLIARPDQRRRAPLPLGHLPRRAATRDRAGQRAAAGAAAAGRQHQPGAAEPERDQPQHRDPGRPGRRRLQRVHAAVRAQPGAGQRLRPRRQRRHLRRRGRRLGALRPLLGQRRRLPLRDRRLARQQRHRARHPERLLPGRDHAGAQRPGRVPAPRDRCRAISTSTSIPTTSRPISSARSTRTSPGPGCAIRRPRTPTSCFPLIYSDAEERR